MDENSPSWEKILIHVDENLPSWGGALIHMDERVLLGWVVYTRTQGQRNSNIETSYSSRANFGIQGVYTMVQVQGFQKMKWCWCDVIFWGQILTIPILKLPLQTWGPKKILDLHPNVHPLKTIFTNTMVRFLCCGDRLLVWWLHRS